jgi:hypothetical protein
MTPLEPEKITVAFYNETDFPGDLLVKAWFQIQQDGLPKWIFYGGKFPPLNQFVRFFDPEKTALVICQYDGDLMGLSWLTDFHFYHKALIHGWIRRKYWRPNIHIAQVKIGHLIFSTPVSPEILYGFIHEKNKMALGVMKRLGFKILGETIPGWFKREDGLAAGVCGYILKEDFYNKWSEVLNGT